MPNTSDPKGKKRARSPEPEIQQPRPKKKNKSTRKRTFTMKTGGNQHKLKIETQVDPEAQGIMLLMWTWIRFLWDLLDATKLPTLPNQEAKESFNTRFVDYDQVLEEFHSAPQAVAVSDAQKWRTAKTRAKGNHAATIARVPDSVIQYLCLILARFGLSNWQPDFREDAYSTYNNTMRFIAIQTLKEAISLLAFRHTGIVAPAEYLNNLGLLVRMYDHIVHHYFYELWRREQRRPGALARAMRQTVNLKRNRDVAKQRDEWMKVAGYPARIRRTVATPDTVSDTERTTIAHAGGHTETVWERKEMVGRSAAATRLAHHVDDGIFMDRQGQKRGSPGFRRVDPSAPVAGRGILPDNVPVDYYAPEFFNSRSIIWRSNWNKGRNHTPVFPADVAELVREGNPVPDFRTLDDKAWEQAHGAQLRKPYMIPTDEQMSNADLDDDDSEMDIDEDEDRNTNRTQTDPRHNSGRQEFVKSTSASGGRPGCSGSGGGGSGSGGNGGGN